MRARRGLSQDDLLNVLALIAIVLLAGLCYLVLFGSWCTSAGYCGAG